MLVTLLHPLIMYALPLLIGAGVGALVGKSRLPRWVEAVLLMLTVVVGVFAQYATIYFAMSLWIEPDPPNARPQATHWGDVFVGFLYYGWIGGIISGPMTVVGYLVGYYGMRDRGKTPGVAMTFSTPPPTPTPSDQSPS